MKEIGRHTYTLLLLTITLLSLITSWYEILVIALSVLLLVMFIDKIGKGIVLRESTAFLYVFTCLIMPLLGYNFYTFENPLSRLWVKYMPVPEEVYFGFALPAIAAFCLALTWPLSFNQPADEGVKLEALIARIKQIVINKKNTGIQIMVTGIIASLAAQVLPGGLRFFTTLFFFGSFAGLLYIYFSPAFQYKKLLILFFGLFLVYNALASGMFTIVAYMGITIFSFFILGRKPSFFKKVLLIIFALGFVVVLQNAKLAFRKFTWQSNYSESKAELFAKLFIENAQRADMLFETKAFFSMYVRTNQGFNVALVMRRIPSNQPHDYGTNLSKVVASALVPRFLWPDKPEAGGRFNMRYYTGMDITGWSTNVGPLGEAYGSFGSAGILFMLFLGAFIRWVYKKVYMISNKLPLLICWLPVLFYQVTYSAETDTLQILNSLLKIAFFIWILYKLLPAWFGVSRNEKKIFRYGRSSARMPG